MLIFGILKFPAYNISVVLDGFSLCLKKYIRDR